MIRAHKKQTYIFFHPDCTVGFGITPNHARRLAGFTAGGEFRPALKIFYAVSIHLIKNYVKKKL